MNGCTEGLLTLKETGTKYSEERPQKLRGATETIVSCVTPQMIR